MSWYNGDGLLVKFALEEATAGAAGALNNTGPTQIVEARFTLSAISAVAGGTIIDDNVEIPKGARIEKIDVINETATTGASSPTLDVGLIRSDRTTELDYNGLVAALADSAYNTAGENVSVTVGSTGAGALLGTTLANKGLLTCNSVTGTWSAGVLRIRVFFYFP